MKETIPKDEIRQTPPTTDRLAQLVEHRTTVREVVGLSPSQTNTQGL